MRQNEVVIGGEYRVKIGSRLAPVKVLRRTSCLGGQRFACLTLDTGREVEATAARLRPLVDSPRRPAPAAGRGRGRRDGGRPWPGSSPAASSAAGVDRGNEMTP